MTRSAFTHQALRNAITQANIRQMEDKHEKMPVCKSEYSIGESEQEWVD